MATKKNTQLLFRILEVLRVRAYLGDELEYKSVKGNKIITVEGPTINSLFSNSLSEIQNSVITAIAHEIGHLLAAPPGRRKLKDFGIPQNIKNDKWDAEDVKAQLFENEVLMAIGCKKLQSKTLLKRKMKEYSLTDWWVKEKPQIKYLIEHAK